MSSDEPMSPEEVIELAGDANKAMSPDIWNSLVGQRQIKRLIATLRAAEAERDQWRRLCRRARAALVDGPWGED